MTSAVDLIRALPVSGKGLALLGSLSVHAAVALAALHGAAHAARNASVQADTTVEIAAPELALAEAPLPPPLEPTLASPSGAARHHHDYPVPPDHDAAPHDPTLRHVLPVAPAPSPAAAAAPAAPAVLDAPAPATPRFSMTVGPGAHALARTSPETTRNVALAGDSAPMAPAPEASVDTPAKPLSGSSPSYTPEAEAAGIEADVPLEIVVDATGAVLSARVLSHVGYGLDEAALRSVRGYRFSPARRAGKTLPVRMRWLMRFQLR